MAARKKGAAKKKAASKRKGAQSKARKSAKRKAAPARPKPGTTIERTFKGKTIKLTVTEDGYRIGKKTHKSLTAAAKAVTGYPSVSGPRFFGTDRGD